MLYSEVIAVCSEIHTKHINTLCGQNIELLNVKHDGTYSNHCALESCEHNDNIQFIFVFCMDLRTNSDYFCKQHYLTAPFNENSVFSARYKLNFYILCI
jgi:hypothetical protein